ncbi:MAG: translation elongation factor Ts [Candidatus Liptonbacteria bacterium]|nr:translation elongation factor Ts [Candidatus Liptonbacteria bacterium]
MKDQILKLRETTGAGVMDCKRAFDQAKGDFDKAVALIHESGISKVEKRADREAGAGMIFSYVHNERIGVLVDLRAETDFVVHSDPFKELIREIAMQVAATAPENVEELLKLPYIKDEKKTVKDIVNEVIAKVGENIKVRTFCRIAL